jgi:polyhydroxyalkanoate synthesis regulator phasin
MNRIKILAVFVMGVMAITITLGTVVYHSASASSSTNQAADTSDSSTNAVPADKGTRGGHGGYSNEDLATALGITADELTAAKQKAHETALTQAVEKGLITQAQADELTTNGTAFPYGDRWDSWLAKNGFDYDALLADALGITVEKLQAAYAQAYNASIDQAVTDGTLTQEQADLMKGQYALRTDKTFLASMQTAFEAAVKQAVQDGVITQAQADLILKNASSQGAGSFLNLGGPHGAGGGPGGGRHGGGHRENVPADATEHLEEPTTTP